MPEQERKHEEQKERRRGNKRRQKDGGAKSIWMRTEGKFRHQQLQQQETHQKDPSDTAVQRITGNKNWSVHYDHDSRLFFGVISTIIIAIA